MVNIPSRKFIAYENLLKKSTVKQTLNERGSKHISLPELDRPLWPDCVELHTTFARPRSVVSQNKLIAMCSDGNSKCTDDSSSALRSNLSSEILERGKSLVELEALKEASEQSLLGETAPVLIPALCVSTTATTLVDEREVCVTSRELLDYGGQLSGPNTSYPESRDEERSPLNSLVGKDLCLRERLHADGVVWKSIKAQGGSPIPLSKAQRISVQEELRRVAALSGQKARLLRPDPACAIVDVQIEERMDLFLKPNAPTCHAELDNRMVGVFHEETSSEYSNPLGIISDHSALACVEREAAGNSNVSQIEDAGLDDLQATSTSKISTAHTREHNPMPDPLSLIITSKIDTQNQLLVVGNSQNFQECEKEGNIEGGRAGKRNRYEDETLTNAIAAARLGACFECKGPLVAAEEVDCSRNDCDRVYHRNCVVRLPNVSWSYEGKLVCPQHVCYACGKNRGSRLWRCQYCSLATHENCIPCPEATTLFHNRPGWAICWRHTSDVDYKSISGLGWMVLTRTLGWGADTEWWVHLSRILQLKTLTWDCQNIFRHLPVPDIQQEFNLTSEFIKEVMENDKEPPPYFYVRRNVFLVKKKRDDADDGVGCSCNSTQDVCGDDCECRVQSMSCSKDCKCSHTCSNKPFRKDKRLKIIKTAYCGWGAFAAETIKKDEFIIEYTGEVIDDAMCEKRLWEMKGRRSISNFYMCEIAKDFIIDATRKGNASRYLNHSCHPNCRLEKWRVDGETRVGVFAGRNIAAGEELNYDYKYVEFGPNVTCRCGAPNCRGAIGERFNASRKSNNVSLPENWGSQHKRSSSAPRR